MNTNYNHFPENRVQSKVVEIVEKMHDEQHEKRAQILSLLVLDLGSALRIGFCGIKGFQKHYSPYQLNPDVINEEQLDRPAILLIHGRMHNQGVWKKIARHLTDEEGLGALFTVNLPGNGSVHDNYLAVQERMRQINDLYKEFGVHDPRFNLVGYSNGGMAAIDVSEMGPEHLTRQITKLVMIGCHLHSYEDLSFATRLKVYAIAASHDFLDRDPCGVPVEKKSMINTTHLGLARSSATARALSFMLKQN